MGFQVIADAKRTLTDAEREDYEERASIKEHDAGMHRTVAEFEALKEVLAKRAQLPLGVK
jgi:hypothetical protein